MFMQGDMINESGTMSGGGGKPRGGRMCLGKATPRSLDTQAVAAVLQAAEQELSTSAQVCILPVPHHSGRHDQTQPVQSSLQALTCHGAFLAQHIEALLSIPFVLSV